VHNRKLLLHRREIDKLRVIRQEKGLSLIPTKMYMKGGRSSAKSPWPAGKSCTISARPRRARTAEAEARAEIAPTGVRRRTDAETLRHGGRTRRAANIRTIDYLRYATSRASKGSKRASMYACKSAILRLLMRIPLLTPATEPRSRA